MEMNTDTATVATTEDTVAPTTEDTVAPTTEDTEEEGTQTEGGTEETEEVVVVLPTPTHIGQRESALTLRDLLTTCTKVAITMTSIGNHAHIVTG